MPDLEELCVNVMQNFTSDEVQILIEEISPNEEEMKMLTFMAALQTLLTPPGRKM